MELSSNNNTIIPTNIVKTPEAEATRIQHSNNNKPFSITNGVLKRHNLVYHPVLVVYKECLKNHAATMGGHAIDGCGEFMPSPTATSTNPTSLKCAACGCHRNFHRREMEEPAAGAALEYQPHHRHHPPPPPRGSGDHHNYPNSPSPPPISSAYYPSAHHMLLALNSGLSGRHVENPNLNSSTPPVSNPNDGTLLTRDTLCTRKRLRTKFTQNQKERMLEFAERVGWRMQKQDEEIMNKLCNEIGVEKGLLKVWMHNNKNNFGRKELNIINGNANGIVNHPIINNISLSAHVVANNGSSSSS